MLFDEDKILAAFAGLSFEVKGVGIWKKIDELDVVAKKSNGEYYKIGLSNSNSAYIRYSGLTNFSDTEALSACLDKNSKATSLLFLVVGTKNKDVDSVREAMLYRLSTIVGTKRRSVNESRDLIMAEEKLSENNLDLLKITFEYTYDYVAPCEKDVECNC